MTNEEKIKEIRKTLIIMFNNAFEDGEDGEELREEHLAERYADSALEDISTLLADSEKKAVEEFGNKVINAFKNGKMGTKYSEDDDLLEKVLQVSAPQIVKGVLDDFLAEGKI